MRDGKEYNLSSYTVLLIPMKAELNILVECLINQQPF